VCATADVNLILENPSVRQLARAIEPLIGAHCVSSETRAIIKSEDNMWRPTPSLLTETLGILMLVFIWLYPVWRFCRFTNPLALIFIPIIHMLAYVVCQRLLFRPGEVLKNEDLLYSWNYYRWWFLERLWSINYYWLQHILGTQFYNAYLQLCGANIGRHAHIYTALIEAPWLLEVGQSTFIDDGDHFAHSTCAPCFIMGSM
ncbi:unnamed protein product, partial [Adineta steineri]